MATILVTRGFKATLITCLRSDTSFKDVASLLTFQPSVIAHLLRMANDACHQHRSSNKPVTVEGIIGILGLGSIHGILTEVEDVSFAEAAGMLETAVKSFVLAKVLAELAEIRLSKRCAPEFFLTGLLASTFEKDEALLMSCHEDLVWRFRGGQTLSLKEVREFIQNFTERNVRQSEYSRVKKVWNDAILHAEHVLGR